MGEKLSHVPKNEIISAPDTNKESLKSHLEALKRKAEADGEAHADDDALEALKIDIENKAVSKEDFKHSEAGHGSENTPSATYISRELKEMGFRRTLTNARLRMKAPARTFSKVIHQPVVEKVSDLAAPTIARPSGILGGGIAALVGSGALLYLTKHYGYRYNYLVFIILFIGGFIAGMAIELVLRAAMRRKA